MSLRALQSGLSGKLKGAWNLFGMRYLDTILKKTAPEWWYHYKQNKTFAEAGKIMEMTRINTKTGLPLT
jgi:hypothetical protein